EKLGQLNLPSVDNQPSPAQLEQVRKGLVGGFLNLAGAQATRDAQRIAVTESRLHIPLLLGLDVIHGYRTIFPIPLAEAATWDPAAAESTARAAAREAAAAGVNWTFAPMVDIARDPRWGRIAEGAGEDPYLGSALAAARRVEVPRVRGERLDRRRRAAEPRRRRLARRRGEGRTRSRRRHGHGEPHLPRGSPRLGPRGPYPDRDRGRRGTTRARGEARPGPVR